MEAQWPSSYQSYDGRGFPDLVSRGITITGRPDNEVLLHDNARRDAPLHINFGSSQCRVVLGEGDLLSGHIQFGNQSAGSTFISEGHAATPDKVALRVRMIGSKTSIIWGRGSTSNGTDIVVAGANRSVTIGRDCMFSSGIWIRTSDMHGIIDVGSLRVTNVPQDVALGDHVWIGQDTLILKGTSVGEGSVVGARSLVNANLPRCVLAVGSPARIIKSGTTWSRSPNPGSSDIEKIISSLQAV